MFMNLMEQTQKDASGETIKQRRPKWYLVACLLNIGVLFALWLSKGTYYGLPLLAFQLVVCLPITVVVVFPRRRHIQPKIWAVAVVFLFLAGLLLNIWTVAGYTD